MEHRTTIIESGEGTIQVARATGAACATASTWTPTPWTRGSRRRPFGGVSIVDPVRRPVERAEIMTCARQ